MSPTPRTRTFPFRPRRRGASRPHRPPSAASPPPSVPLGRVPRVARLQALALRCDQLIAAGVIANYAALAELGHVSRARPEDRTNIDQWQVTQLLIVLLWVQVPLFTEGAPTWTANLHP